MVSVIIPCHDQAHFLAEAIESVLAQTHEPGEVIVVDDGSLDDTAGVAARYPGVRYVRQERRGLSAARNAGIALSGGGFLVFLDADDRLLPDALAAGLRAFTKHPDCAFVAGDYRHIARDSSRLAGSKPKQVETEPYHALLHGNFIGMHAAVIYRRIELEEVGGFDTSLQACEDHDLYFRITSRFSIHCHREIVAEYRRHDANMTDNAELMLESALRVLHRQRTRVRSNPHYAEAWRSGIEHWREYYGSLLSKSIRRRLKDREWQAAAREFLVHVRHCPGRSARLAWQMAIRRAACTSGLMDSSGSPPVGAVRFGSLRRLTPLSREFGFDRGQPIDRYYIERFLAERAEDINGRVLEIGDDHYTRKFGRERVRASDVLHVCEGNPKATIVADLTCADHIPDHRFDCIICTQTLQCIYDLRSAVHTLYRILRPGGVLLVSVPGISQLSQDEWAASWYWGFTAHSSRRLLEERFPARAVRVESHGNVLAATAFLQGLCVEDLRRTELERHDPQFQLLLTLRAVKPEGSKDREGL